VSEERPVLRLVREGEAPAPDPPAPTTEPSAGPPSIGAKVSISAGPISKRKQFDHLVQVVNITDQASAVRLSSAALQLASGAVDLRREAAAEASENFRRGVTPGEKAAEAAIILAKLHLDEAQSRRTRPEPLRRAALSSSNEVKRSVDVAATAGIDQAGKASVLFENALELLSPVTIGADNTSKKPCMYLIGCDVLAAEIPEAKALELRLLVAGLIGRVIVGIVIAAIV